MEVLALGARLGLFALFLYRLRLVQTVLDASVEFGLLSVQVGLGAGVLVEADDELRPEDELPIDSTTTELAGSAVAVAGLVLPEILLFLLAVGLGEVGRTRPVRSCPIVLSAG